MEFRKRYSNPTGKKGKGDCVIRAIAHATKKGWLEIYDELCKIGREQYDMPNMKPVYEEYLRQIGWSKNKMPRFKDNTRYTVKEFAEKYKKGSFIISVANHLTAVIDGDLFDTWDCSYKSVGNYWSK